MTLASLCVFNCGGESVGGVGESMVGAIRQIFSHRHELFQVLVAIVGTGGLLWVSRRGCCLLVEVPAKLRVASICTGLNATWQALERLGVDGVAEDKMQKIPNQATSWF